MCNFSLPFAGTIADLIEKAKQAIISAGGTFNGTATSGSFFIPTSIGHVNGSYNGDATSLNFTVSATGGHITGSCKTTGTELQVNITHKPFFISCDTIKEKLAEFLS